MKLAFIFAPEAFGAHRPPIDVRHYEERLMTGTDLCAVRTPLEMARRGNDVTLYMDRAEACVVDGMRVEPYSKWQDAAYDYDIAVAVSNPNALMYARKDALRVVNRQVAKFGPDCQPAWEEFVDLVLCPSKWARDIVRGALGDNAPRFDVLPSGCDLPTKPGKKISGRCVYISSPDRGLHWVLGAWSKIRARAPHASLIVSYEGIGRWVEMLTRPEARPNSVLAEEQIRRAHYIQRGFEKLAAHGVECIKSGLSHRALGQLLSGAEALLYPLDPWAPTETFGVAVLEAQSHGVVPVISDEDCFGELWSGSSACVPAPVSERMDAWIEQAIRVLTDEGYRREMSERARANAAKYTWAATADRLESVLAEGLRRKHEPPRVSDVRAPAPTTGLTIHGVLSPYASGDVKMDPHDPFESRSGGGCRTGFVQLMRGLAGLGHRVRAFSTWANSGIAAGVECFPLAEVERYGAPDALIAYYDTRAVTLPARVTVASHHTYAAPFPGTIGVADLNTAPSGHAMRALRSCHGGARWLTLPNIVPPGLPEWAPVSGRVIYHTSPDRGLHILLAVWPEIRRLVPHAELHVVGEVLPFAERAKGERSAQGERARAILDVLPRAQEAGGVHLLGRLTRAQMLREIAAASCFAFPASPSQPCETWSTSVAECMAVGVPVVLAPCDALGEVWGDAAVVTSHVEAEFCSAVAAVLTDTALSAAASDRQRRYVAPFTSDHAARILDAELQAMLAERAKVA